LPQKKSTIKRLRQDKKINARNRAVRSQVATAIRKIKTAPAEERDAALKGAVSAIDKAAKAGVMKKETASRRKSRLVKATQKSS
jgi:small subunit ribosomal protein S20